MCDGTVWNSTKPECLTAPHPPSLSVIVDSVQVENPVVSVGQEVTLTCHGLGGNPPPTVHLYINGEKVGEEGNLSGAFSFRAGQHHDRARISCAAWNSFHQYPVHSRYQVITLKCKYTHLVTLSVSDPCYLPSCPISCLHQGQDFCSP